MKAAIYVRVSTVGQAQEGDSLEMQKEKLLAYITSQGWELFKIYEDAGISGGTSNRPAFQEMLKDARSKKFDILLVYKIDRLSRSILDFHQTMQVLQANNISFVSLTQQFDTSTSMGRLMLAILVDFANFEREINIDRSRDSYLSRLYKGIHSGRTPFGYKREDGKLVVTPDQAEAVKKAFDLALKGHSSVKIAQELGMSIDLVKSILTNPIYTGFVCPRSDKHGHRALDYSKWHKGQQDAIISLDTFKMVTEKRSRPIRGKHLALFSRLIYCPYCKHNLTAQYKKDRFYYRCMPISQGDVSCKQSIKENELEAFLLHYLEKTFKLKIPKQKGSLPIQEQVARIDRKIQKAIDLIDVDGISAEEIKQKIENLKKEKEELLQRKETIDYKKVYKLIKSIKEVYNYADRKEKQELWALLVKQIILYKEKIEVHFVDGSVSTFNRKKLMFGGDEGI